MTLALCIAGWATAATLLGRLLGKAISLRDRHPTGPPPDISPEALDRLRRAIANPEEYHP